MDGRKVPRKGGPSFFGCKRKKLSHDMWPTSNGVENTRRGALSWRLVAEDTMDYKLWRIRQYCRLGIVLRISGIFPQFLLQTRGGVNRSAAGECD